MEEYKLSNITDLQLKQSGVVALADRPNAAQQYGQSGLSATMLKQWFDKLAILVAKKINELQNAIQSEDATKYIGLALGKYEKLNDLIVGMQDGSFASDILKLYPEIGESNLTSLQSIIYDISKDISDILEDIEGIKEDKLSKVTEKYSNKRVYGVDQDGNQTMITLSKMAEGDAAVGYTPNGSIIAKMSPIELPPGWNDVSGPGEVVTTTYMQELQRHIGAGLRIVLDPKTYEFHVEILNIKGELIFTSPKIDLPLESVVVGCDYNEATNKIEIKLQNGTITEIPVEKIVNGLVTEAQHKADKDELNRKIDEKFESYIIDVYNIVGGDYVDYS